MVIKGDTIPAASTSHSSSSGSFNKSLITETECVPSFPLIIQRKRAENRTPTFNHRILLHTGKYNVFQTDLKQKTFRFVKDFFNTLINIRWRYVLASLCLVNGLAYIFFAYCWMLLAEYKGDFEINQTKPCIIGTRNFTGYLILSIETLTTIGSGEIYPDNCHESSIILTLQALTSVAIEGAFVSAIYTKLSRPGKELTEIFTKNAVICLRDGKLSLIFKISDPTGKYRTYTNVKAYFIGKRVTREGVALKNFMRKLTLEKYGSLIWPLDFIHVIDESSPLWDYSAKDLLTSRFEIMAVLQGESLTTGQPSQARASYTNEEILWGHRFKECTYFDEDKGMYIVDGDNFNITVIHQTPLCSASRYQQLKDKFEQKGK